MKQKTVELSDFKVVVSELRLRSIRKMISNFYDLLVPKDGEELNISALLGERFDDIIDIFSEFMVVKNKSGDNYTLEDLTGSDIEKLVEAMKELNSTFLMIASNMAQTMFQVETIPTETIPTEKSSYSD